MQPPVAVPANGGPPRLALVTRPEGANVMTTLAVPEGSPSLRQVDAALAADVREAAAAARSNGPAGSEGSLGFGSSFGVGRAGSGGDSTFGLVAGSSAGFVLEGE